MKDDEQSMDPAAMQAAFDGLAEALGDRETRESFSADPHAVLEDQSLDVSALPVEVVDALAEMSPEELEMVSRIHGKMLDIPGRGETCVMF